MIQYRTEWRTNNAYDCFLLIRWTLINGRSRDKVVNAATCCDRSHVLQFLHGERSSLFGSGFDPRTEPTDPDAYGEVVAKRVRGAIASDGETLAKRLQFWFGDEADDVREAMNAPSAAR